MQNLPVFWCDMARLSNLLGSRDRSRDPPVECRVATRIEIERGLRLILAGSAGPASDDAVLDFLAFAMNRRIETSTMRVALVQDRIVWAMLPIVSPGRTVLVMSPGRTFRQTPEAAMCLLAEHICSTYRDANLALVQVLLDPEAAEVRSAYAAAGFNELAELLYLQRGLLHVPDSLPLPPGLELQSYDAANHSEFARTIEQSYEASLDCPALNGVRGIADVIAGHKAAGFFDPSMWFLLRDGGKGLAVLLLNASTQHGAAELVYLGVAPSARGRRLGDFLMRLAMAEAARREFTEITLAVDSQNQPALQLYYRHGMKRLTSRIALIHKLAQDSVARSNAQQVPARRTP